MQGHQKSPSLEKELQTLISTNSEITSTDVYYFKI